MFWACVYQGVELGELMKFDSLPRGEEGVAPGAQMLQMEHRESVGASSY